MLIGLCFGLSLTDGGEMFYNSLLMPVVGMLGYGILGWKSLYKMPLLLAFTFVLINFLGMLRGTEYMDLLSVWMWTFIYSFFVLTGIAIAALLHYAFRRENHHEK